MIRDFQFPLASRPQAEPYCAKGPNMPGQLLTQYFLTDGIKETPEWKELTSAIDAFRKEALSTYEDFAKYQQPNESVTEQDLIRPILEALGWNDYLPQQGSQSNEDIPDHLLFADAESKSQAVERSSSQERFLDTLLIEESKRFNLPLDSRDQSGQSTDRLSPRANPQIPVDCGHRHGRQNPMGNPDQRLRMAPV